MGTYIKAEKTMLRIAEVMEADQGASYRTTLEKVLPHIGDAYRGEDVPFRSHMGASLIGSECARAVWYGFHWTVAPKFPARVLRLFNRGHLEEARFIALLLIIGADVFQQDAQGKQFRISDAGGHFGGSGDGVAMGIPDVPAGTPCLLEFKTHNDKSFKNLVAEGVRHAKFEHYVQMNVYMGKMGIPVALYGAVNKNDDDLHLEIVHFDRSVSDMYLDRGRQLVFARTPPDKISQSPGWYKCKFCDYNKVCHAGALPAKNCRTCVHSFPADDGQWYCGINEANPTPLTMEVQLTGCNAYETF